MTRASSVPRVPTRGGRVRRGSDGDVARFDHLDFRGEDAVASAWLRRGRALLRDHGPCAEQGYITLLEADIAAGRRRIRRAPSVWRARRWSLARGIEDAGVEVVALALLGCALVASGAVDEGLRRLDECAPRAVGEEFAETAAPGWALCHTVSACADVGDFARATQWCRALHTWSAVWQARHFFGVCRTAYGEVLATAGDWRSAEQELLSAMEDLPMTRPGRWRPDGGSAWQAACAARATWPRRGRCSRRRCRCRRRFSALGELDLAAGDATAAADAADRVLRRVGAERPRPLPRARAARARRAAAGDGDGARPRRPIGWSARRARLATPYSARARPSRCARTSCRRRASPTGHGRPPRTPPTCSPGARRRTRRRKPGAVLSAALEALGRRRACRGGGARGTRGVRAARRAHGRSAASRRRAQEPARGRHPAPRRAGAERRPDRRAAVPQPAHGAPPHREHPDEAPGALARGRGGARHPSRPALTGH